MKTKSIKKILITGGCGFIGSHLSEYLFYKYKKAEIIIYDKITYAASISNLNKIIKNKRVLLIKKDICNLKDLIKYSKNVDLLLHLAAESHVDNSFHLSEKFISTNVLGTKNVMEASLINKVKKVIHISTDEVYGEISKGSFKENNKMNPSNPYSSSKAAAEMIVSGYIHSYSLPVIILRPNNIYGSRQHPEKLISGCCWCFAKNKKFSLHGNGFQKRTYLHVKDFCRGIDILINKGKIYNTYNIGTRQEYTNKNIVSMIAKKMQRNFNRSVLYVKDRLFNDARYSVNYSKIKKLGWKPLLNIESSLTEIISWNMRNHKLFNRDHL
jgi:dTDP-glucose 4,6-dehydratase